MNKEKDTSVPTQEQIEALETVISSLGGDGIFTEKDDLTKLAESIPKMLDLWQVHKDYRFWISICLSSPEDDDDVYDIAEPERCYCQSCTIGKEKAERSLNKRIRELRLMKYEDYLATPEWKKKRETKLEEAKHCCQLCSSTDRLQVHHKTYERRGYEDLSDLIVLCGRCHAKFHDKVARW